MTKEEKKQYWKIFRHKILWSGPAITLMIVGGLVAFGSLVWLALELFGPWVVIGFAIFILIGVWVWDIFEKTKFTFETGYENEDQKAFSEMIEDEQNG